MKKKDLKNILKSNQGFSLLEILIALALIAIVTAITISNPFNNDRELDNEVGKLESAVRFMSDEAVLRNSVVRLHLLLDNTPQEYAVEFGPSDDFVIADESEENNTISPSEQEKLEKQGKELNLKFNKVQEFQESNHSVNENVRLIGIGNAYSKKLKTDGDVSLYTFATGEKDQSVIYLGNDKTVVSIEVSPFTKKIKKTSHNLDDQKNTDIMEAQKEKAAELFSTWLSSQN